MKKESKPQYGIADNKDNKSRESVARILLSGGTLNYSRLTTEETAL